jgi:hypothetical protein
MKLRDFLPFEINYISSIKTIQEINNILLAETDKTLLFNLQKRYRGKFNELNIHLWDNNIILFRRQHYYLKFLKTNADEDKIGIRIFSRNSAFLIFVYTSFMIVGIYGLIGMLLRGDGIGIIFLLLWILFIFIASNFIWKKNDARK